MKNKKVLFGLCVMCCFLFISCDQMIEGKVIGKWHEDARQYTTTGLMPMCTGKSTILIPYTQDHYDDEDWCIKVDGYTENEHKEVVETYYVLSSSLYEKIKIGQTLNVAEKLESGEISKFDSDD